LLAASPLLEACDKLPGREDVRVFVAATAQQDEKEGGDATLA